MKKLLILFLCIFINLGFSQDNSDAELLLNKVSENIKNYETQDVLSYESNIKLNQLSNHKITLSNKQITDPKTLKAI